MSGLSDKHRRLLEKTVTDIQQGAAGKLVSVVLYGAAAHGEDSEKTGLNLMIVLSDLELATLLQVAAPIRAFCKAGQPMPHIFSPALIKQAADVFAMEFLDIQRYHALLYGQDVLAEFVYSREHLRLQCERELREKMMRLVQGAIDADDKPRALERLIVQSIPDFARPFRGFLTLSGLEMPRKDAEVFSMFALREFGDPNTFAPVFQAGGDIRQKFATYYSALTRAVDAVNGHDART